MTINPAAGDRASTSKASPPRDKWAAPRSTIVDALGNANITDASCTICPLQSSGEPAKPSKSEAAETESSRRSQWATPGDTVTNVLGRAPVSVTTEFAVVESSANVVVDVADDAPAAHDEVETAIQYSAKRGPVNL